MPQDTPKTCDGCGKRFYFYHPLSFRKGGLVLARHDNAAKEGGALGACDLVPSAITYKHKINSRAVQVERNGAGARQESGMADGGADIVGECQGGSGRTVNGAARLVVQPGQVQVPAELRVYISAHSFWKWGTTAMFDI